ncbi:MAG: hypothetical protein OXC81_03320 [Betaproteobacteria bacterium]|nr:hypothetical protein [Betaproteobacteria bacterium]
MSTILAVADTSVLINLIHSGCPAKIVSAAQISLCATDQVLKELKWIPAEFESIRRHIKSVTLSGNAHDRYMQIAQEQNKHSLDDGEATTLAYALERNLPVLMDDRKGLRACKREKVAFLTSVDVFRRALQGSLSRAVVADAVYRALQDGRMQVQPDDEKWVVRLIGKQRAKGCLSLPARLRNTL